MLQNPLNVLFCILLIATVCLCSCSTPPKQPSGTSTGAQLQPSPGPTSAVSMSPVSQLPLPAVSPIPTKELTLPPKPEEVKEVVARVFENVATPDTKSNPGFVIGDFNGDGSEDIAVVVKPNAATLPEINNELANWVLEDPKTSVSSPPQSASHKIPPKPPPVRAQKDDSLLAIIHGVGSKGWRDPEARQSFLLKNGVGANMTSQSARELRTSKDKQNMPSIRGDGIRQTIGGQSGLVYWTGAKYGWYSPGAR